jgi:cell wall-associated NlpC family hydrolase
MAKLGTEVSLRQVEEGDLVFFRTSKNRKVINHVGLVIETRGGNVKFIHSTTSSGVIISSLEERYWNETFVEVRRII